MLGSQLGNVLGAYGIMVDIRKVLGKTPKLLATELDVLLYVGAGGGELRPGTVDF